MTNDLINRSALGVGYANPLVFDNPEFAKGWNAAIEIIAKVPAVDAVEVVSCKDCIHYEKTMLYSECWHELGMINVYDDCYCSRGERKTDG